MLSRIHFVEGLVGLASASTFAGPIIGVEMPRQVVAVNISGDPQQGYRAMSPIQAVLRADVHSWRGQAAVIAAPAYNELTHRRNYLKIVAAVGVLAARVQDIELDEDFLRWLDGDMLRSGDAVAEAETLQNLARADLFGDSGIPCALRGMVYKFAQLSLDHLCEREPDADRYFTALTHLLAA